MHSDRNNPAASSSNARLFGTDGVRGVANVHPMTVELTLKIGQAVAHMCRERKVGRHQIVIGKDPRLSGYMIEAALTAGLCSMGADVLLIGPMTTPGIAFLTRSMRADAGLVISASHNPYRDNGIKIFSRDGYKLPDALEDEIERLIVSGTLSHQQAPGDEVGRAKRIDDAMGRYIVFCKRTFPEDYTLEGLKVVIDCAHGAAYKIAPIILSELGAEVVAIHCSPNGMNINDRCGSQYTEALSEHVREANADVGLAFDGDGDRMIAVDEHGVEMTGDHLLVIGARMYKDTGRLTNNLVVGTVMCNLGFGKVMQALGIDCAYAAVGDRYVLEMMRARGAVLGGEPSGHLIYLDQHTTGDGIISALQLLSAMRFYRQPASALAGWMTVYPQRLINVDVTWKPPLESLPDLQRSIRAAETALGDRGRVLVRYSGTQLMCRVMVEGPTDDLTDRWAEELATRVREYIG